MSFIRRRMTYANVAMTVALVFALSGGAYAASKYVITSTKQIKPSVLKGLVGRTGPVGAVGPAGSAGKDGAQGPAGEKGAAGSEGKEGAAGKEGAPGKNGTNGAVGPAGQAGATGPAGPAGATGPTGSPWPGGGTLPSGSTEKGAWAGGGLPAVNPALGGEVIYGSISFTIPLVSAPSVQVIGPGEKPTGKGTCPTTSSAENPEAEPGNLCIFVSESTNLSGVIPDAPNTGNAFQAGPTGATLWIVPTPIGTGKGERTTGEGVFAAGTWAVTAE